MKGFKEFIMRGNIVDLAVAVIIGGAFGAIVKAFADDAIGGLIAQLGGQPDIGALAIPGTQIVIGTTITAAINFLIVAAVVYFVVVKPMNKLAELRAAKEDSEPEAPAADVALLTEIRDLLKAQQRV